MHLPPVDRLPHWRPQGADPYSSAGGGAPPLRPVNAGNPAESIDRQGAGAPVREPGKPTAPPSPYRDWTMEMHKKQAPEQPPEPPPEPIYKQLLELIRSIWRASGSAVEVAQDIERSTLPERLVQHMRGEPPTYTEPRIKRTGGV